MILQVMQEIYLQDLHISYETVFTAWVYELLLFVCAPAVYVASYLTFQNRVDNGGVHVKINLNSASLLHEFFIVPMFEAKHASIQACS